MTTATPEKTEPTITAAPVDEIPTIQRETRASKYEPFFEQTRKADPKPVRLSGFGSAKTASGAATYIRRNCPDDIDVTQRGEDVYLSIKKADTNGKAKG